MKVLLTGAGGLVGSTIPAQLRLYGRKDLDLRDYSKTLSYFEEHKPDAVIHTAAKVGGLGANMNNMAEFYRDNILINTNVLEAARVTKVKKTVSFLSTCIFPADADYPLTEDQLHNGEPHLSNFGYAYAKRMIEVQSSAYGSNFVCVIPTNVYGPWDNFSLEDGHVIPSLIHKCYLAKTNNTDFVIWGSGEPLREFIFSSDVGDITERILSDYTLGEPMILSTSYEVRIREVAELIGKAVGFKGKIRFDKTKPDGQYRKPTSNSRLKKFLPNYKFTPLEEGIDITVDWFMTNYPSCRK